MQDVPLTIDLILRRAASVASANRVVSVQLDGTARRTTWGAVAERAARLAGVLETLGVPRGGRVGTFAWNTDRHLELYYGVPCSGRVLHTGNVRLHPDQIAYVVTHAADEVLFVDASLTATLAPVKDRLPTVREVVVMEDGGEVHEAFAGCPGYEALLAEAQPAELSGAREGDAASICFTSGTTGKPKAVVYSHRSVVLHSMGALAADSHGVRRDDVVLPLTPMFHVNAWGLPYTAALAGASLVLAGRDTSPERVARIVAAERVTVAAGIPTFWIQMDRAFAERPED